LLWEFPQYQWKKIRSVANRNDPERPRDYNDHAMDALRYMIMSRFPPPQKIKRGEDMVSPFRRKRMESLTTRASINNNQEDDSMFGSYGDTLGFFSEESGGKEWQQ